MQESQPTQPFQITKVWARNFRSIANTSVELDRLTVLVGPNAAGKSNVLEILRFVKDALRFDLEVATSFRLGPEAIQRQTDEGPTSDVELGLAAREGSRKDGCSLEYSFVLAISENGSFHVRWEHARVRLGTLDEPVEFRIEDGRLMKPEWLSSANAGPRSGSSEAPRDFNPADLWLCQLARIGLMPVRTVPSEWADTFHRICYFLDSFNTRMMESRFYHIFPNTIREPQRETGESYPLNENASNLALTLRFMKKQESNLGPFGAPMRELKYSLPLLIPGVSDFDVVSLGGYLAVRLKHDSGQSGTWIDLSQESDGTVRLLGLLAALCQTRSLPLTGIEEPELTVHPGAMAQLADLLNEASRRSQVIVTTHSPDLIDCLTDYRAVENLRIVELVDGVTVVRRVADSQVEAVRKHLFSPGELHRMGELELPRGQAHE